jgi:hypothetical protein
MDRIRSSDRCCFDLFDFPGKTVAHESWRIEFDEARNSGVVLIRYYSFSGYVKHLIDRIFILNRNN